MANIRISKNEGKSIKAMNNATNSVINNGNIILVENEEKLLKVIKNNPYLIGNLIAENSELIKKIHKINQHFASIAQKIIEANRIFSENISKIDFGAINRRLQEILDDFFQFVESIEEEKRGDYYILLKKYGEFLKEKGLFVSEDFKDFWSFWLPYNFKYLGLGYDNYNNENDKYKLEANDFELYHEYENLIIFYRKSSKDALEIVWNNFDKRNTENVNIVQFQIRNDVFENKKENTVFGKIPNGKQKKVLKLIVDEMRKGTQKTDAINDSYRIAGYKTDRQVWTIVKKVEKGELVYNEFTELLKNK